MRKKNIGWIIVIFTASCILFTSCLGSFGLTKKLYAWNNEIDNKFVNTLVFAALVIVPVYPVSVLADMLVINSIEFWSNENPVADTTPLKQIKTESGTYLVETVTDGYLITKEESNETVKFVFDTHDNSWSIQYEDIQQKLFKYTENEKEKIVMFLPGGQERDIMLNASGLDLLKETITQYRHMAVH